MTTTQLQLRRDTAANIGAITPAQGEPIYDVTNATLRMGDGATAGGNMLAGPYAAGSWTPTLFGSTTAGTPTYTVNVGSYERIGRLIVARFNIAISAIGGMAGTVRIGGLPFTSANVASDVGSGPVGFLEGVTLDSGYSFAGLTVAANHNFATLYESGSNKTSQEIAVANWAASAAVSGVVTYHV
jgi:Major tropism determinant N-terminal domain